MGNTSDGFMDLGAPPTPLPETAPLSDVVRIVNQLNASDFQGRVSRHDHRERLNNIVDKVRAELLEDMSKLTLSQQRIERGLFGDDFGQKGIIHRLESLEQAVIKVSAKAAAFTTTAAQMGKTPPPVPVTGASMFLAKVQTLAIEWMVKIALLIIILIAVDYGHKAFTLWKSGVQP